MTSRALGSLLGALFLMCSACGSDPETVAPTPLVIRSEVWIVRL